MRAIEEEEEEEEEEGEGEGEEAEKGVEEQGLGQDDRDVTTSSLAVSHSSLQNVQVTWLLHHFHFISNQAITFNCWHTRNRWIL